MKEGSVETKITTPSFYFVGMLSLVFRLFFWRGGDPVPCLYLFIFELLLAGLYCTLITEDDLKNWKVRKTCDSAHASEKHQKGGEEN